MRPRWPFIKSHIICIYGVPHELISDKGVHFKGEVDTLLQRYGIYHHKSSTYKLQTNGVVEAVNKNIKRILLKMMARAFKKRVNPRPLQRGDLVLRVLKGFVTNPRGKFRPNWSEPFIVRELTPEELHS